MRYVAAHARDRLAQRNRVYGRTGAYERLAVNGDERFGGRPKRQRKRQRLSAGACRGAVSCSYTCSSYVFKVRLYIYNKVLWRCAWWPLEVPRTCKVHSLSHRYTEYTVNSYSVHWPCACYKIRNPTGGGVPRQALGTNYVLREGKGKQNSRVILHKHGAEAVGSS